MMMAERKLTYQDALTIAPDELINALTDRLPVLWDTVARQKQYAELSGDDYDPIAERQKEISHLIGRLKRAHAALESLRIHEHEWSENEYCFICGADGRA